MTTRREGKFEGLPRWKHKPENSDLTPSEWQVEFAANVMPIAVLVCRETKYHGFTMKGVLKAECPNCGEFSLHAWPETNTWRCFSCEQGGSPIQFFMEMMPFDWGDGKTYRNSFLQAVNSICIQYARHVIEKRREEKETP